MCNEADGNGTYCVVSDAVKNVVRTKADLDSFDLKSHLPELSDSELEQFKESVGFFHHQYQDENGVTQSHKGIEGFSMEIPVNNHGYSESKVEQKAADIFGLSSQQFSRGSGYVNYRGCCKLKANCWCRGRVCN